MDSNQYSETIPKKTFMYISHAGLKDLKHELAQRSQQTRKEIAESLSAAKELGDLSENFEYQDAKDRQALNEARILQLQELIRSAVIVKQTTGNDQIIVGCTFTAQINNQEKTYSMVGSTEANPLEGKISNESPLGKALIGHRIGESITVQTPNGQRDYKIISIQ